MRIEYIVLSTTATESYNTQKEAVWEGCLMIMMMVLVALMMMMMGKIVKRGEAKFENSREKIYSRYAPWPTISYSGHTRPIGGIKKTTTLKNTRK